MIKAKKWQSPFFEKKSQIFFISNFVPKNRFFRPNSNTTHPFWLIFAQNVEENNTDQQEKTLFQNIFSFPRYLWSKFDSRWSKTFFSNIAVFLSLVHQIDLILHIHNVFCVLRFSERISSTRQPLHTFLYCKKFYAKIRYLVIFLRKIFRIDTLLYT